MIITHCEVHTTPEGVEVFREASLRNAEASRQEPGVLQFECLQSTEDPTEFCLVEHYKDASDVESHKTQPHFLAWREAVNPVMARPRRTVRYEVCA